MASAELAPLYSSYRDRRYLPRPCPLLIQRFSPLLDLFQAFTSRSVDTCMLFLNAPDSSRVEEKFFFATGKV